LVWFGLAWLGLGWFSIVPQITVRAGHFRMAIKSGRRIRLAFKSRLPLLGTNSANFGGLCRFLEQIGGNNSGR